MIECGQGRVKYVGGEARAEDLSVQAVGRDMHLVTKPASHGGCRINKIKMQAPHLIAVPTIS